jgi:hypothetical protein
VKRAPVDPAGEDPIGEIFERAVSPYADGPSLRKAVGPKTPVIRMRPDPNPGQGEPTEFEGGTIRAPILDALRNAAVAGWQTAGEFDFDGLGAQEVALVYKPGRGPRGTVQVVSRAAGGAFLLADLDQMIDDLAELVQHPSVTEAIPWADELFGSLARGIRFARDKFVDDIHAPRAGGRPSLADEFTQGSASGP